MVLPDIASPSEGDYYPAEFPTILAWVYPVNDGNVSLSGICCNSVARRQLLGM
jgi:hypothetical protein